MRKTATVVLLAGAGLLLAWVADRHSLERANRLYRQGAFQEAATLYAENLRRDGASSQLRYNLGTALLALRSGKASEELTGVSREARDDIQVRALYNLGLWDLIEALLAEKTDLARAHALRAVATYKSVLRLKPGHADASWNLAICLRLLASIEQNVERKDDDPNAPRAAEGETAAHAEENIRLSLKEAADILGTGHRDPTTMVEKLMASEGRALRLRASGRTAEPEQ